MHPIVYVAGKYRDPDPTTVEERVKIASEHGGIIMKELNAMPIIPHPMYHDLQPIIKDMQDEFISMCCAIVARCDALYILPGSETSLGTSLEIAAAERNGIPVCKTKEELKEVLDEMYE
jgi:hypothetical protein